MESIDTTAKPHHIGKKMSLEEFLNWEPDDDFVYEWSEGAVELKNGNGESMKNSKLYLVKNIEDKFFLTKAFSEGNRIFSEIDCLLPNQKTRRPDLAYFTKDQIIASAKGENPIPAFVIEIISPNDNINRVEKKVLEYFEAGVRLVWHIFPEIKLVRIFNSAKESKSYIEGDSFTAEPVLPELQISVIELFTIQL